MPVQCWLLLAVALALLCAQRHLRRALARALMGRTRQWRLRLAADGSLRARGFRLRLYGVDDAFDPQQAIGSFGRLAPGRVRWRVLAVDSDGTMAIVARAAGRNIAVEMLRCGAVAVRGTGARRYRLVQARARVERRGMWRHVEHWPAQPDQAPGRFALPFPWWQG